MACYVIASVEVTDPEDYVNYASHTEASVAPFGGEFLVKGGAQSVVEGSAPDRHAVIRFPDRASAEAWYGSDDYQRLLHIALSASRRTLVFVDGV
ncbi:DUF1330 domain-containing protein [Litorisediminicola beolgyonensis]|uniref:DUF1330 domain-containing protein n=1 Tax=Litorisediminicola beolgyonensis TaxID=1173614 RepID=A0ABW3ZNJ7_9RHOB